MNLNKDEINFFGVKTDPSKREHVARREPRIQSIKRENISIMRVISHFLFFFWSVEREKERERERERKVSFGDSQDFVDRNSSGQELKFIASTRATRGYRKEGISPKIHRRGFGKIKGFKFRKCFKASYGFYGAPRGRDSSYFDFIPTFGLN